MDKCPNCGAKVYSSDKRCSKCGHELKKSSNNSLIAFLLFVVAIAIVGILVSGSNVINDTADVAIPNDANQNANSLIETTFYDDSQKGFLSSNDDSSISDTVYWASEESNKFHKSSCEWAQKISDDNKIVYMHRQEAINDGRVPCEVCNP